MRLSTMLVVALMKTLKVLCAIPRGYQAAVGCFLGRFLSALPIKRNQIMTRNIELCFAGLAPKEREAIKRQHMQMVGRSLLYTAYAWHACSRKLNQDIAHKIHGLEALKQAESQGKGVLLLLKHSVHLELDIRFLGQYLTLYGMAKVNKDPAIAQITQKGRERAGREQVDAKNPMAIVRWLKQGKTVVYLPDQDYGKHSSLVIPFMGQPAATITVPHRLAQMTGCAVWICQTYWQDEVCHLELEAVKPSDSPATFMTAINDAWTQAVTAHPESYLWFHRRFKSTLGVGLYQAS